MHISRHTRHRPCLLLFVHPAASGEMKHILIFQMDYLRTWTHGCDYPNLVWKKETHYTESTNMIHWHMYISCIRFQKDTRVTASQRISARAQRRKQPACPLTPLLLPLELTLMELKPNHPLNSTLRTTGQLDVSTHQLRTKCHGISASLQPCGHVAGKDTPCRHDESVLKRPKLQDTLEPLC